MTPLKKREVWKQYSHNYNDNKITTHNQTTPPNNNNNNNNNIRNAFFFSLRPKKPGSLFLFSLFFYGG